MHEAVLGGSAFSPNNFGCEQPGCSPEFRPLNHKLGRWTSIAVVTGLIAYAPVLGTLHSLSSSIGLTMSIPEWTQVMPWVTGGLAGSMLTYALNQRAARKKQARLVAETGSIALSPLKSVGTSSPGLMVSYNAETYEELFRFEMSVVNVSGRTSTTTPFLFTFSPRTQVAGIETVVSPLDHVTSWELQGGTNNVYLWNPGELRPSDRAKLVVFHTSSEEPGVAFRGDDDVDVTIDSRASRRSIEYALTVTGVWAALYVSAGAVPDFGDVVRGFLVFLFIPFAARWGSKVLSIKRATNSQVIEIDTVQAETVSFVRH